MVRVKESFCLNDTLWRNCCFLCLGIFWIYAIVAALGLFFILFMLPETKGKTVEEVEGLFVSPWRYNEDSLLASVEKPVQYVHIRGLNRDGRNMSVDTDSD